MSVISILFIFCITSVANDTETKSNQPPNFILIFIDDMGYNDLGCYGSKTIKTPHIDQLASEGLKLTDFHVPSPVCSPSRAGLLTGSYPKRVGMEKHVIFPYHKYGLHPDEWTIADQLKSNGYATACIGKWHLGHIPETLPTSNGFDSYYGIPYSNDMSHPTNKEKPRRMSQDKSWKDQDAHYPLWKTPLMRDQKIIEFPVNQRTITRRYTDQALTFIERNKNRPFFLYLPHSMPHIPLYVPDDAYDPDPKNAYKCVVEHIDTECGRIFKKVRELNLADNTYIIFTSDNGPWLQFGSHGGNADPLRAGKGTTFEGGQRVPCIIWAPGRIPKGQTSDALTSTMDLLPTIATLSGYPFKGSKKIDGLDITKALTEDAPSPRSEFIHYTSQGQLAGIRQGKWKYLNVKKTEYLFDLDADISEKNNLAESSPEKVATMKKRMLELDAEITKNARPVFRKK